MTYAEVAVDAPGAGKTFSYAIPPAMPLAPGHMVWVPFGARLLQGVVLQLTPYPSVESVREVSALVDPHPLLSPAHLELARWMSEHYLCTPFEAAAQMLPPGIERRFVTFVLPTEEPPAMAIASLTPPQREVLALLRRRGRSELEEIRQVLPRVKVASIVDQLLRKGLVSKERELERVRVRPRVRRLLRLAIDLAQAKEEALRLAQTKGARKQATLLKLLCEEGPSIPLAQLRERIAASQSAVNALLDKSLIVLEEVEEPRDPLAHRPASISLPLPLTVAQEKAWGEIEGALKASHKATPGVFLLHGVTGSGKTELYLRSVSLAASMGKRAIVLVPEIALTPQTVDRFLARFPGSVALLHSKLSLGEQFDEWRRIRDGGATVVVGSRGALFAPQTDLGIIIIDEEHEWAYKQQERPPRYHAREAAIKLAQLTGSLLILGSATPDVESYYYAQRGAYRLLELPERIDVRGASNLTLTWTSMPESGLPQVEIVDLRQELRSGNRSIFSRSLGEAIDHALGCGEQVILFLNRRGSAGFVQCRDCGFVLRCKRCAIALTYHAKEGSLLCHQCNYQTTPLQTCPQCWSRRIRLLGVGTQRVEEETSKAFPQARLLRWDRDVTGSKRAHEEILDRFFAHEADILIGTQMVAKGLDLPRVTLVGVICADIGLHFPDFRSCERTFQILTQVAGRAGRGPRSGRVIIQTYLPDHYAVAAASRHDYKAFYEKELRFRHEQDLPPFSRLARLLYLHTNPQACQKEAERVHRLLKEEVDAQGLPEVSLIGPSPAYLSRLRGRYRWQIVLRGPSLQGLLKGIRLPAGWSVDIDPVSLL